MKKLLVIIILLFASVACITPIVSANKVLDWILEQEYTRTQLENVTRVVVRTKAENLGWAYTRIQRLMGGYNTLLNAAWSDWRERRIEAARTVLESKVHEYDADGIVLYMGQKRSPADPNNMVSVYAVEVDLNLERN